MDFRLSELNSEMRNEHLAIEEELNKCIKENDEIHAQQEEVMREIAAVKRRQLELQSMYNTDKERFKIAVFFYMPINISQILHFDQKNV
ncbi:conserved hypothetical protein [Trichinella spiralis]|uniref:hypothetical protein n=1 Tax=Trichinella spiralis TaxID=6334 RepID=UPI0001EFED60|nr:conserved hypothetical protein [Trichinella spiralis]